MGPGSEAGATRLYGSRNASARAMPCERSQGRRESALNSAGRTFIKPIVNKMPKNASFAIKPDFFGDSRMAFGITGSRFAFLRLNLGPKAVLGAALLIAVNTALVAGAGYWSLSRDFDNRALNDIDVNLRTLSLAFGESFANAKIALKDGIVDRVDIAKMPEFSDHKIVDRATSYVGGVATLFVYDDATQAVHPPHHQPEEGKRRPRGRHPARGRSSGAAGGPPRRGLQGPGDPVRPPLLHRLPAGVRRGRQGDRPGVRRHSHRAARRHAVAGAVGDGPRRRDRRPDRARHDHADRAPRHRAPEGGDAIADRARRGPHRRRGAPRRPPRRDRRDRPHHRRVQEQPHRAPAARTRARRRRSAGGGAAQGRAQQLRRRLPQPDRRHHRAGAEFLGAVRAGRAAAFGDGAFDRGDVGPLRRRLAGGFRACPHRRGGLQRIVAVDRRDQPPGSGVERGRHRRGQAGQRHRRSG